MKFTFYRYNIDFGQEIKNKQQFLNDGFIIDSKIGKNNKAYKFINIENDSNYIYGLMVKYDPRYEEEILNEKTGKTEKEKLNNRIEVKNLFLIDFRNSIIALENTSINKNTRLKVFRDLFQENHKIKDRKVLISLQEINRRYEFYKEIKNFIQINEVKIKLKPSNPRFNDRWKSVDEDLRDRNVTEYSEKQVNQSGKGISINESMETKFYMAEDGYGSSEAKGLDSDNQKRTISTQDTNKVVTKELKNDSIQNGFVDLKDKLSNTFTFIVDRILNNE